MKEFFISPDGKDIIIQEDKKTLTLTEKSTEIILSIYKRVEQSYPKAYKRLRELYGHHINYKWWMVRRFIKCNWGLSDNKPDIEKGNYIFEHVHCPLRAECIDEDTICHPEEKTDITPREHEIIQLIAQGLSDSKMANKLFISIKTVENHRNNIHKKLDTHSKAELVDYAHKHNLIK